MIIIHRSSNPVVTFFEKRLLKCRPSVSQHVATRQQLSELLSNVQHFLQRNVRINNQEGHLCFRFIRFLKSVYVCIYIRIHMYVYYVCMCVCTIVYVCISAYVYSYIIWCKGHPKSCLCERRGEPELWLLRISNPLQEEGGWLVSTTLRLLYLPESPGTHFTGAVGLMAGLDG